MIHPTVSISPLACVGENVSVGENSTVAPFAVIEDGVAIGARCHVAAHAVLKRGTRVGDDVHVDHHAVLGGLPQDLGFDPATPSGVVIGDGVRIREGVTLHRATRAGENTLVGTKCFLMAYSHVAHDCVLGEGVIVANTALLAGFVQVGARAFVSGGVVVHQFVRIGESAMCSGNGRFGMDIPPFVIALERNHVAGLNLVGLRRCGFSRETLADLKNCYRAVYREDALNFAANAAEALEASVAQSERGRQFLRFFTDTSKRRQFVRPRANGAGTVE
ncbi:MAG: acyl-ACP--UDP-N-acetylglucosamine O-acyltransferase [Puniceicoccales bacterium]|jgi:UDP-N-acetylglucosamine acyltransferase|nr:acyl-ACP--UDP-N-acetylglucosamine O-acyltransferase [Puniceicoccales bacterium]